MAPWADVLYACDGDWWDAYINEARQAFAGEMWTQDDAAAARYKIFRVSGESKVGLGKNWVIHFGGNGGYQLINLVYHFGAKKIILLGFDMQRTNGLSHHHGDHPGGLNRSLPFKDWLLKFNQLARDLRDEGVEVVNATRETALTCFQKMELKECL